jgi:rhodanese-related sulfurtransferase
MKKLSLAVLVVLLFSLLLGACAPAAAPVAEAPVAAAAAEQVVAAPAPDVQALWSALVAAIPADKGYGTVSAANLNTEMAENAPFLLDVREAAEVETDGYIDGAVNIPVRDVLKNLDKLPGLDEAIVVYCASGHRGAYTMAALRQLGYTNVRNLAGGLGGWKKAEFPVVTGSVPAAPVAGTAPVIADQALYTLLTDYMSNLPEGFGTIKADALNTAIAESAPTLVDVRTADEYNKNGRIEGAINVPLQELFASLDKLPAKDQPIVIYCVSGHRGAVAQMGLQLLGYTNVKNLAGGINAWKAAQFPIVGYVDWNAVWGEFLTTLPEGYYSVSAANLNAELAEKTPLLVDVREATEYAEGHLSGAINLPVRSLLQNLDKLPDQAQPIVIYCVSGHRGSLATAALRLLGYTDVRNLGGGMNAWKKAEFPVEAGEAAALTAGTAPVVDATRLAALDAFLANLPEGFYAVKAADLNLALGEAEKPFIVDLRTAKEVTDGGMIEGAINIPVVELWARLSELPQDKAAKIVTVCGSGHRGAMALAALRMNGYTEVTNLAGGMGAWLAAELPVVK